VGEVANGYKASMFAWLGAGIARRPGSFILFWVALVAASVAWSTLASEGPPAEVGSFLPEDDPLNEAVRLSGRAFPNLDAHSVMVVIAHREGGLDPRDFAWLDALAESAKKITSGHILSPATPYLKQRLVSPDGRAAMVVGNLSSNFISVATAAAVEKVEQLILSRPPPVGLTTEITGTAGVGRDYAEATRQALDRTTWVTIVAVLAILIFVYRSPVGALVPLVSIGVCVYIAFALLDVLARFGLQVASMERIFAVVLIFGMGVDFALFWIARYREILREEGLTLEDSAVAAMRQTGPAIVASAGTTICGLTTLLATGLVPTRSAGKVLAVVLSVTVIAALTLSPALARRLGRALFWPMGFEGRLTLGQRLIWPSIARRVSSRPWPILILGTLLLGSLAVLSVRIPWRFDSLSELPKGSSSQRGYEIAKRHFARGQLYSNQVLLHF